MNNVSLTLLILLKLNSFIAYGINIIFISYYLSWGATQSFVLAHRFRKGDKKIYAKHVSSENLPFLNDLELHFSRCTLLNFMRHIFIQKPFKDGEVLCWNKITLGRFKEWGQCLFRVLDITITFCFVLLQNQMI